jgi:ribonuclease HII
LLRSSNDKPSTAAAAKSLNLPKSKRIKAIAAVEAANSIHCLPRTREYQLLKSQHQTSASLTVIGVDEAGRGPLAGPVVAAAVIIPTNISGIIDSKKITAEMERERLYEELISSPNIRYAVAVVSAQRIDEINILQATLEGMRMAVEGVMGLVDYDENSNVVSAKRKEASYVVTGRRELPSSTTSPDTSFYHALIDGNKMPKDMPCPSESIIKGDGKEYSIGAASILAKVTRDRLMHEYDKLYPEYNLRQHKGYPTQSHMDAVRKFGASPIHRRTFAPLKNMEFDEDGKVVFGSKK